MTAAQTTSRATTQRTMRMIQPDMAHGSFRGEFGGRLSYRDADQGQWTEKSIVCERSQSTM
jgi:hypothetical protein